jgi:endoglucanase
MGLLVLLPVLLTSCSATADELSSGGAERSRSAAQAFLDRYVEPDGRVVRRDQGGDTVSEGVSYALLLAQVAGDQEAERRVWAWADRLRRPDGLLSYLADAQGEVVDAEAATDADLVVGWALSRSRQPELRQDAAGVLDAVRQHTVVTRPPGPLLAAGPWATGEPATLNPSYWVLPALRAVGWDDLAAPVGPALDQLTSGGALPPDWARQDGDRLAASPDPAGRFPQARHGLDAQRVLVWLAADCDPANRRRAAGYRPLLQDAPEATARTLTGEVLDPAAHPLGLVAAAAAADADGDTAARDDLLDRAAEQDQRTPTYYGAAWVALGRALLQDDVLDPCEGSP